VCRVYNPKEVRETGVDRTRRKHETSGEGGRQTEDGTGGSSKSSSSSVGGGRKNWKERVKEDQEVAAGSVQGRGAGGLDEDMLAMGHPVLIKPRQQQTSDETGSSPSKKKSRKVSASSGQVHPEGLAPLPSECTPKARNKQFGRQSSKDDSEIGKSTRSTLTLPPMQQQQQQAGKKTKKEKKTTASRSRRYSV
jgi:hypothetical protein